MRVRTGVLHSDNSITINTKHCPVTLEFDKGELEMIQKYNLETKRIIIFDGKIMSQEERYNTLRKSNV